MKYQVFQNNIPAQFPEINVHPSWANSKFETFKEACLYAINWMGNYFPKEINNDVESIFELNVPYIFLAYELEEEYMIIKQIE